jgi:hypothetical protein
MHEKLNIKKKYNKNSNLEDLIHYFIKLFIQLLLKL